MVFVSFFICNNKIICICNEIDRGGNGKIVSFGDRDIDFRPMCQFSTDAMLVVVADVDDVEDLRYCCCRLV
jgi:hypothetical protein